MSTATQSTAVVRRGLTIIETAVTILAARGESLGPAEIADYGIRGGLLRIPRGRNRSYLTQLLQSRLHEDAEYSSLPLVYRPVKGKYRVRKNALRALGLS